ncbi:hypothetical protein ACXYMX_13260 [Sporosarcina sp. CAU 1771]
MKVLKSVLVTLIVVCGIGYGVYYYGLNWASDKVVNEVTAELKSNGYVDDFKKMVSSDPELKQYIEEVEKVDRQNLAFTTKEEAMRLLIKKIGISELLTLQSKAEKGMSENEILFVLQEMEGKFTDEEILALKVLAFNELTN